MKPSTKFVAESLSESVIKLSDLEAVSFKDLNVGDVISSGGMGGDPVELATVIDKQRLSMRVKVTHALGSNTKQNLGRGIEIDYSDTAEFGRVKKSALSKINE